MKLRLLVAVAALLSLAVLAGSPVAQAAAPAIKVAKNARLGDILTDERGMTLYVFKNDSPGKSTCTGGCAQAWPAFTVDDETNRPAPASGVTGKVGVIDHPGGKYQVTFNDLPLYFYARDAKTGDANGQGIGGVWSVVPAKAPTSSAAKGKSTYTSKSTYGKPTNSKPAYGMGSYGNYGLGSYGAYGMGGCGCYGYNYGYMRSYYPPYVPYFRVFRPVPYLHRFPFYGGMGMMRRY